MASKNRYHSDFILQYKLGLLPDDIVRKVAPSTKHYWRSNSYNYFAPEALYAQQENMEMVKVLLSHKKLLQVAKAAYKIHSFIHQMASGLKTFNEQLVNRKTEVVSLIEQCKVTLGLKRACRIVGISVQQFYTWRNDQKCHDSVFGLCRRRFSNQLTAKEVSRIKSYLTDPRFTGWSNISVYYQMLRDGVANMSKSTFYRYTRKMGLAKPRLKKRKRSRTNISRRCYDFQTT